jgi:hypothetical protein
MKALSATDNLETNKRAEKRQSERISLSLPIEVWGTDLSGRDFKQKAVTKQLARYGGTMILGIALGPEQVVAIQLLSGRAQEANVRIVGQVGLQTLGHVYGFAFQDETKQTFWGIHFPPLGENEDFLTKVVVECGGCSRREIAPLNEVEFDVFEANDRITRHCGACRQSTTWKKANFERTEAQPARPTLPSELTSRNIPPTAETAAPPWPATDLRRARRVKVGLKGCVLLGGDEQIVSVSDLSRGGIRFHARRKYDLDQWVQVAVPYTMASANIFRPGKILWRKERGDTAFEYGLKFVKS